MNIEQKEQYGISAGIGIVAVAAFQNSVFAIASGVAGFAAEFSDKSATAAQMIVTFPSITALVVALIVGVFASKFSTKNAVLFGIAIIGISGPAVYALSSYDSIIAARFFFGIGIGIISPICISVVSEYYVGQQRATMIGIKTAVQNGFALAFSFFGGILAARAWREAYLLYLVAIPLFFVVLFLMPKRPSIYSINVGEKIKISGKAVYCCFYIMLFWIFLQVFLTNSSMLINDRSLGDASTAGFGLSVFQVAAIIAALVFGTVYKTFKEFTLPVASAITAIGLLLIGSSGNILTFFIGSYLAGTGFSLCTPKIALDMFRSLNSSSQTFGIGVMMSFVNIGLFLSPILINLVGKTPDARFYVSAVGLGIMTIFVIGQNILSKTPQEM